MIRLWLWIPAVQMYFECCFPTNVSFSECITYLNGLLEEWLDSEYRISSDAWFIDEVSGARISTDVTLSHLCLHEYMCITVL